VVSKQLDEFRARSARLLAERDGLSRPEIPAEMTTRLSDSAVRNLLAAEGMLFTARATARDSQKELLRSRVSQLNEEIGGLDAQVASKAKQLELIAGELTGVQELYEKRLVPLARLTALQRESARIEGERGQLTSAIAETKAKIGEAQLQIVRIDQDVELLAAGLLARLARILERHLHPALDAFRLDADIHHEYEHQVPSLAGVTSAPTRSTISR